MPKQATLVLITALAAAAATAGCDRDPAAPADTTVVVRTDKPAYSLATDAAARTVLVNLGPGAVHAPMGTYVFVERRVDGRWQDRRAWFIVDGTGPSFAIQPGDSVVALSMQFGYVDHSPGVYRFIFDIAHDDRGRHRLPESQRASEPFLLTH
jgi:hypothetical protein